MGWTSPAVKHAVILGRVAGTPVKHLAATYGLSVSTIERIIRKAKETTVLDALPGSTSPNLERLKSSLLLSSHVAIDRSLDDTQEVHKAASTGLAYLRGVGEHGGERTAEVNVQVLIANVPPGFDALMSRHGLGDAGAEVIESKDVTGMDDDGSP